MKKRFTPLADNIATNVAPPPGGIRQGWASFWFTSIDPMGLHVVRLLAGLLFLFWLLAFVGEQHAFFGLEGWFDRQAYREAARLPGGAPVPMGWSLLHLCGTDPALLQIAYWLSVVVLVLFTVGLWTRITAPLTWVIVASFIGNPASGYGGDYLLSILAFYLMIGYVFLNQWSKPQTWFSCLVGSRDSWLLGSFMNPSFSHAANLALRLLQVHFAIIVTVSGLHKLQFGDWWSGVAFWYPLHPPLETTTEGLRADAADSATYLFLLSLAQYGLLAWQLGFSFFAWRRGWRPVLLGGAILGWLGSIFLYREPLVGPILCIACLSYLAPAEWRSITNRLASEFVSSRRTRWSVAAKQTGRVAAKT